MKQLRIVCLGLLLALGLSACAASGSSADPKTATGTAAQSRTEATVPSGTETTVPSGTETAVPSGTETAAKSEAAPAPSSALPVVMSQTEYVLYQNILVQNGAEDYLGKPAVKEGVLTRLTDAFSGSTRYYVWGYYDATKCCDWQWEFVPKDPDSLPPNGSRVKMTGTLVQDEAALDKLWFVDAEVALVTPYTPEACDVDMTTMNSTLERVQLLNMQYRPDAFQGKTLRMYGRVFSLTAIQHPYYDGSWTQELSAAGSLPAIGTMILVTGTWDGGSLRADRIEETDAY